MQRVKCKVSEGRHINFARDPLRSCFHEPQKNETHPLYLHFVFTSYSSIEHYIGQSTVAFINYVAYV